MADGSTTPATHRDGEGDAPPVVRPDGRWRPSLQLSLAVLVALFAVVSIVGALYHRSRTLTEVRDTTKDRVTFQASLAADAIGDAVELTKASVAELAANPVLAPLFAPGPPPPGCSLAFTGAGPFAEGHIDIVDAAGTVRCSSTDLPALGIYADQTWLTLEGPDPAVVGQVDDPATGHEAVVVATPVDGMGVVASFLAVDGVTAELGDRYGGPLRTQFRIIDRPQQSIPGDERRRDTIAATAEIRSLGWTVEAAVDDHAALAHAEALSRDVLLYLAGALLVLLVATQVLYRRVARPIERLTDSVRRAMNGDTSSLAAISGPAEVVALAEGFSALSRDVAAELARREQAERDARASEESYKRLFAANPLTMWIYDAETLAYLEVNDAAEHAYGYSRDEFLGMTIRDIRPAEDLDALIESTAQNATIQRSGPWRHVKKDGTAIEVEVNSHAVTFAGRPARFVMVEDITQRERTRRLLEQAQRMESLGQLAGGIAHDFNNILAVMLNYAEFAAEELTSAAQIDPERWGPVLRDVEHVGDAGRRAAELTGQLLAFARGESVPLGPVDLNDIVSRLEAMLRRTLGEHVDLELALSRDADPVVANRGQLEQVVVNLAVNARDAMPAGGRLSIDTMNVDVDENHGTDRPELAAGRYVRLRVSDTGAGMPPDVRDRAFEPFFTTKERGGGTGFGLAMVYGIVTRAGGTVRIYSEPGLGTSISVLLPASKAPAVAEPAPPAPPRPSPVTETVLVVEDDDNVREVAERILSEAGYRVLAAADGTSALELAEQRSGDIDLVLSDVVMPGMLGSELAERLRASQPGLRVLLMSGYAPPVLVAGGTLASGAPLLDKPFSAKLLREKVREALEGPPPTAPTRPA